MADNFLAALAGFTSDLAEGTRETTRRAQEQENIEAERLRRVREFDAQMALEKQRQILADQVAQSQIQNAEAANKRAEDLHRRATDLSMGDEIPFDDPATGERRSMVVPKALAEQWALQLASGEQQVTLPGPGGTPIRVSASDALDFLARKEAAAQEQQGREFSTLLDFLSRGIGSNPVTGEPVFPSGEQVESVLGLRDAIRQLQTRIEGQESAIPPPLDPFEMSAAGLGATDQMRDLEVGALRFQPRTRRTSAELSGLDPRLANLLYPSRPNIPDPNYAPLPGRYR